MDSEIFIARVDDTAQIAERTQKPKFLGFLTAEQAVAVSSRLKNRGVKFGLWGGYDDAQRVVLGCFPDWADEEYPVSCVTFTYRKSDALSHRDFLGSLMGLGLKRESVGDILVGEGKTVVFLLNDILKYVTEQVTKIGRVGVNISVGFPECLPQGEKLEEFRTTVASERLDCVIAALCNFSRNAASEKIIQSMVTVNSFVVEKPTHTINTGDIISVRGKGKFIIGQIGLKTRKDRDVVEYKKYI